MSIRVINEKCRGCSLCAGSCPFDAIQMSEKLPEIGPSCTECGSCLEACKFGALEKVDSSAENGMNLQLRTVRGQTCPAFYSDRRTQVTADMRRASRKISGLYSVTAS